jgi:hypothetical protein
MFDSEYNLKLIDFGLAAPLAGINGDGLLFDIVGT